MADERGEVFEVDELVRQAAREVDMTLIRWALSLSPLDRLRAAVSSASSLHALRDAKTDRAKDRLVLPVLIALAEELEGGKRE
jgi:hypothetical protein